MKQENNLKQMTRISERQKKYMERFYEPEFSAYDFMCLFCAVNGIQQKYSFDREILLSFIKSCKLNGEYTNLLDDINFKSNGVFYYSEELQEAITKLKLAGVLYTISPERDSSILISIDTHFEELMGPRNDYLDQMEAFVSSFNTYVSKSDLKKLEMVC